MVSLWRKPIFRGENIEKLRRALVTVKHETPFKIDAAVVLPEHMHFLWSMPRGDSGYSQRVGRFKLLFTKSVQAPVASLGDLTPSRRKHRESNVWHRRFWEHTIRDEADHERHPDYIHYNPVKHGLVTCPHLWP
jgi:putative transposase